MQPIKREIKIDGFNSIYYFEFGKDFSHPPEKHDFWEMVYVDSGDIIAVTDGIGQTLRRGQMIFHKPMEVHAHVSNNIISNNMLVVSFSAKSDAMQFFDRKIFDADKTVKTLLKLFTQEARLALGGISGEYSDKSPLDFSGAPLGSLQLMECYFTELLLVLMRQESHVNILSRTENSRELGQNSIAELIAAYLEENVYASVTLGDVCSKFFLGKSQLSKIFKDYSGVSPMEYYLDIKINEAKRLLNSEVSVTDVSDALGYSSIHNFSRAFKKITGMSPSQYKQKTIKSEYYLQGRKFV